MVWATAKNRPKETTKRKAAARPCRTPIDRSLGDVLRDSGFYFFLPTILAPSFFDTAVSFHLLSIAALKSWSAEWVTSGYAIYAAATIGASMWMGALVDRLGPLRLFILSLIPYIVGTFLLGFMDHAGWAWVFLALYGMGSGIKATLIPVLLSEVYGTRFIGAIRSFVATLSVFGSALGPPALGLALDLDVSVAAMTLVAIAYFIVSSLLMVLGGRRWSALANDEKPATSPSSSPIRGSWPSVS